MYTSAGGKPIEFVHIIPFMERIMIHGTGHLKTKLS